MAREAGAIHIHEKPKEFALAGNDSIKNFEALVRADERWQGQKWFDAVTAQHKQLILAELQAFNKERQQYADWLDEAAADIEDWGMYASEYLQQKWDLPDQVQDYKNRAAAIRARGQA
jgi:hypothetical protein